MYTHQVGSPLCYSKANLGFFLTIFSHFWTNSYYFYCFYISLVTIATMKFRILDHLNTYTCCFPIFEEDITLRYTSLPYISRLLIEFLVILPKNALKMPKFGHFCCFRRENKIVKNCVKMHRKIRFH